MRRFPGTPIRPNGGSFGSQFPAEAYDSYMKQQVRAGSRPTRHHGGYIALVDKCPALLLVHSQGGSFGFSCRAAGRQVKESWRASRRPPAMSVRAAALKNTPTLMVFGDYSTSIRAGRFKKIDTSIASGARRRRHRRLDHLPDIGIKGNSHMLMQDKNTPRSGRDSEMAGGQGTVD